MPLRSVHNEKELLIAVAEGNEKAFGELFYAYHNQLAEYILLLTNAEELTKEIVQDVFVKIWMSRKSLPAIHNFPSYLFILTRNYTLNCIRCSVNERKKREAFELYKGHDEEEVVSESPPQGYELVIDRAVAQLPPQQQKVFVLKQAGRKNTEIANELGISPGSVKKYQQWAIKSVSEFVKNHVELTMVLLAIGISTNF